MIRYIPHALQRMQERGITRGEVESVLANHDTTYPSPQPGRTCYIGPAGPKRLKVVARTTDSDHVVVTAHFVT